jgi:hypothetical protein
MTALLTDPPTTVADRDAPPQVLNGLGEVGKTQLALEYAYRHQLIWWVAAAAKLSAAKLRLLWLLIAAHPQIRRRERPLAQNDTPGACTCIRWCRTH